MKKLNYKYVKEYFEEHGCILLEREWNGCFNKMRYICKCGNQGFTDWAHFMGGRRCSFCGTRKRLKKKEAKNEYVKKYFKDAGCKLLDEYENKNNSLRFICNCGREDVAWWPNFRRGTRCKYCRYGVVRGMNNSNWNPDRASIELNKKIKEKSYSALKNTMNAFGQRKMSKSHDILGYTTQELKSYLTNHPNWNFVKDKKWSIDHIFPIKAFSKRGIMDFRLINCFENLQPVLLSENLSKNDSYCEKEFEGWLKSKGVL